MVSTKNHSDFVPQRFLQQRFRTRLRIGLVVIAVACTLATAMSPAMAQRYDAIAPKINQKQSKSLRLDVLNAIRNPGAFSAAGKKSVDDYFKNYFFPVMTQYREADLAGLGDMREDLFKRYLRAAAPESQAYMTNLSLIFTPAIAIRNFHPAVRYNATLILGMLDQKYSEGGANPVPLPAATAQLLELLEKNEFKDVKVHPSVKVGALEGLERHVRFGLDPQYADRVTKAALAVLEQDRKVLDVDADVNNWMKGQAARVLARQFQAGPTPEVQAALTKLIASEELGLAERCDVAELLKRMTYAPSSEADLAATVLPLGNLTRAVVADGAKKAKKFEDLVLGVVPGGGFRPGGNEIGPKFERRQILGRMLQIDRGADALSKGLPDAEKQKLTALTELLAPVISTSRSSKALDVEVAGEVRKLEREVDGLVAGWKPVAPAKPDAPAQPDAAAPAAAAEPAAADAALVQ